MQQRAAGKERRAIIRTVDRMQEGFEPVVRIAAKSNVPIYTVDSRGFYRIPGP